MIFFPLENQMEMPTPGGGRRQSHTKMSRFLEGAPIPSLQTAPGEAGAGDNAGSKGGGDRAHAQWQERPRGQSTRTVVGTAAAINQCLGLHQRVVLVSHHAATRRQVVGSSVFFQYWELNPGQEFHHGATSPALLKSSDWS